MPRLDDLTESRFVEELETLEAELRELKTRQFVGGGNITPRVVSHTPTGFELGPYSLPAFGSKKFKVVFTPAKTGASYVEFYVDYGYSGGNTYEYATVGPDNTTAANSDIQNGFFATFQADAVAVTDLSLRFKFKTFSDGDYTVTVLP